MENEEKLSTSLKLYKCQLEQVETAISTSGSSDDLDKLKADLSELIQLTEESLLNVKKQKLLAFLNQQYGEQESTSSVNAQSVSSSSCSSDSESDNDPEEELEDVFKDLIGKQVCVPHCHDWGHKSYHSAMIISVQAHEDDPKVTVLFLNPTHRSMVPCDHFLNESCTFGDNCRYSHGYTVSIDQLKEYIQPSHSLQLGSQCLAKWTDRVWYPGQVVECCPDHQYKVMFDEGHDVLTVGAEDLIPYGREETDNFDDDSSAFVDENEDIHKSDDEDDLPVYLWRPQTLSKLGDWEQYTRAIGSKLMQKMGYIHGDGLGKRGQGRAEPVPIQLLPAGKSLDTIMHLKEIAGDRDLYDVMKQQQRKKKKQQKKEEEALEAPKPQNPTVFEFINKKLQPKIDDKHLAKKSATTKQITEKDLRHKSDKGLNIQLVQTQGEVRSTEKQISKLKESLLRQEGRDSKMANDIKAKIQSLESYLQKLHSSSASIQKHQSHRSNHKKLTVF